MVSLQHLGAVQDVDVQRRVLLDSWIGCRLELRVAWESCLDRACWILLWWGLPGSRQFAVRIIGLGAFGVLTWTAVQGWSRPELGISTVRVSDRRSILQGQDCSEFLLKYEGRQEYTGSSVIVVTDKERAHVLNAVHNLSFSGTSADCFRELKLPLSR